MLKSKGPLVWIILSAIILIIALVLSPHHGQHGSGAGHWEFTF